MRKRVTSDKSVVLFDGVCNLCSGAVRFIIARDPGANFRFAALQSTAAKVLLGPNWGQNLQPDSIVLIESGVEYTQSTAVLRIARRLHGLWPLAYVFIVVPKPARDKVYDWIANHRYRWFGRKDTCMLPTADLRVRFLHESEIREPDLKT